MIFNYMIVNEELKIDRIDLSAKKWEEKLKTNFLLFFTIWKNTLIKILSNFFWGGRFELLLEFLQEIIVFQQFSSDFAMILIKFSRNFAEYSRKCWELLKLFSEFLKHSEKCSWISERILTELWCEKFEWFDRSATESFNSGPGLYRAPRAERAHRLRRPLAAHAAGRGPGILRHGDLSWKIRCSKIRYFSAKCIKL